MMAFVPGRGAACGQAMMVFLFTFVRWFGIPSPFAAALLLARAEKPTPADAGGRGRVVGGESAVGPLNLDVWQVRGHRRIVAGTAPMPAEAGH